METGKLMKYLIIFVFIIGIFFIIFDQYKIKNNENIENNYKNTTNNLESSNTKLPQCSDGLDNDDDGLVDLFDSNCKHSLDNNESNIEILFYIAGIIIFVSIIYFYKKINKNKNKIQNVIDETVNPDRGYELMLDWFLRNKATDIAKRAIKIQKDGTYLLAPIKNSDINEVNRQPDKYKDTGEYFQISHINVKTGCKKGNHIMTYSLSRGEADLLKGGPDRFNEFETILSDGFFQSNKRKFNMSVHQSKEERLANKKIEANLTGDFELVETIENILEENKKNNYNNNYNNNNKIEYDEYEGMSDKEINLIKYQKAVSTKINKKMKKNKDNSQQNNGGFQNEKNNNN